MHDLARKADFRYYDVKEEAAKEVLNCVTLSKKVFEQLIASHFKDPSRRGQKRQAFEESSQGDQGRFFFSILLLLYTSSLLTSSSKED